MKREKCKLVVMAIVVSFMLISCAGTEKATSGASSYNSVPTPEEQALYYALWGAKKVKEGNYDGAVEAFKISFKLAPPRFQDEYKKLLGMAYGVRGIDKGKRGYLNSAVSDLETCISLMPKDGDQKDFEKALSIIYVARAAGNEQIGNDLGAMSDYLHFLKYARQ
jgi:hypothetical protein